MSVITVVENTGSIDENFNRRYQIIYRVDGQGTQLDPAAAINAVGAIPGTQYISYTGTVDLNAYCTGVSNSMVDANGEVHLVTCEFGPANPNLIAQNPLDVYPHAKWSTVTFTRPIDITVDGEPIVNTAYDTFDPQIEMEDFRPIMTIFRNEAAVDPITLLSFKNKTNLQPFGGWEAGKVLCTDVRWTDDFNNDIGLFYRVEYDFQFTFDEWGFKKKVMSAGYRELFVNSSDDVDRRQILIQGMAATSPVPLDEDGHKVDISVEDWREDMAFLEFKIYDDADFDQLNFVNVLGWNAS